MSGELSESNASGEKLLKRVTSLRADLKRETDLRASLEASQVALIQRCHDLDELLQSQRIEVWANFFIEVLANYLIEVLANYFIKV